MDVNDTPSEAKPVGNYDSRKELINLALCAKNAKGIDYARSLLRLSGKEKVLEVPDEKLDDMVALLRTMCVNNWPELFVEKVATGYIRVDDELNLLESQIEGLLEGDGATDDHKDVLKFLYTHLRADIADRVHKAIVNAEVGKAQRPMDNFSATSVGILERAVAIQNERAKDYDQPSGERSMDATVLAFNVITRRDMVSGRGLTESEGWLLMQILKDVRDRSTAKPHRDSLEDCVSYSALKAEARLKE